MKPKWILILTAILLLVSSGAYAQENTEEGINRWSGRLELGVMGINTTSQLYGIDSEDVPGSGDDLALIDSLDKNNTYESLITTFFLFDINYALNATTSLYLETPFYNDDRMGVTAGVQKFFQDNSLLDLSVFLGGEILWEDPYLTGVPRETTVSNSLGLYIDYDGIKNTEWNVTYILRGRIVYDDLSGDNNPALERSGTAHTLKTGYNLFFNDRFDTVLTPALVFIREDWKGGAYANNGFGVEASFAMEKGRHGLIITGGLERHIYDDLHPLFQEERADWLLRGEIHYTRNNLWDSNWYARVGCWLKGVDSNIGFFDENFLNYGVSVGYSFD
jgi:hypothetical protein